MATTTITPIIMDPVTRIEGHMKVEVSISNGVVSDAKCTGTLFRGFETILKGRDPRDAPNITQRICGVCPVSHAMASTLTLESAAKMAAIPANARIMRNLVLGANFIQSHILHFYLLAALDYVKAPAAASPWTPAWYTETPDARLNDTRLNTVSGNIVKAIEMRRIAHEMGAVFGAKLPMPPSFLAGGFSAVPNAARISTFKSKLNTLTSFIKNSYLNDVQTIATLYPEYSKIGKGHGNLLAFGAFDGGNSAGTGKLFPSGVRTAASSGSVSPLDITKITEQVSYSWYSGTSSTGVHPSAGVTNPVEPGTKAGAYSWLKAPRYNNLPYEAGPLARMSVGGFYTEGISVMHRHIARAREALVIAQAMGQWLDQLNSNLSGPVYQAYSNPSSGKGAGLTEAPRGALGHWVSISSGKISNYQVITPTCWNASPRDASGVRGPMEQALIGTPVADPNQPIEVLRVIHSFDPCMSCAVHVMRPKGKPVVIHFGPGR